MQGGEIVLEGRIAQPELDRAEAAGEQSFRLIGEPLRRHQTEAAGIVGGNALGPAADERRERQAGGDCQRIPGRHVEPGHGHADDALHADQGEAFGQPAPEIDGREAIAFDDALRVFEDVRDRRNRRWKITPQIRAAGDALFGIEIDEQQRRLGDGAAAGAERIGHGHLDADAAEGAKREDGRAWLAVHI